MSAGDGRLRRTRLGLAAAIAICSILAVAPASSAGAGIVTLSGGTLGVSDASATGNAVTITIPLTGPMSLSGEFSVVDLAGIGDPVPGGCTRQSGTEVRCPTAGVANGTIRLGPGDDSFFGMPLAGSGQLAVDGGEGSDRIDVAANAAMVVTGGPGDDLVAIMEGQYPGGTFSGDEGNDTIFGNSWPNELSGGDGNDGLFPAGGRDIVAGGPGNDKESGGRGNDRLRGEDGDDRLNGGDGKDRLAGGPGIDTGKGGPGKDKCASIETGSNTC